MKNFLLKILVRAYLSTVRHSLIIDSDVLKLEEEGKRLVFFCWHNQLALFLNKSSRFRLVTMVSRSKDGDMFAPLVESFGHKVVRASSSRGGSAGLIEMISFMDTGYHAAMAADGPKGPKYEAKPGVLYLAKKADCILVPVLGNCSRFFRFNSWDSFILPKPFAKVELHLCKPITVSNSTEKETVEKETEEIENKIMELTRVYSQDII